MPLHTEKQSDIDNRSPIPNKLERYEIRTVELILTDRETLNPNYLQRSRIQICGGIMEYEELHMGSAFVLPG